MARISERLLDEYLQSEKNREMKSKIEEEKSLTLRERTFKHFKKSNKALEHLETTIINLRDNTMFSETYKNEMIAHLKSEAEKIYRQCFEDALKELDSEEEKIKMNIDKDIIVMDDIKKSYIFSNILEALKTLEGEKLFLYLSKYLNTDVLKDILEIHKQTFINKLGNELSNIFFNEIEVDRSQFSEVDNIRSYLLPLLRESNINASITHIKKFCYFDLEINRLEKYINV